MHRHHVATGNAAAKLRCAAPWHAAQQVPYHPANGGRLLGDQAHHTQGGTGTCLLSATNASMQHWQHAAAGAPHSLQSSSTRMRDKGLTRPHGLPQQRDCARGDRWPDTLEGTARCTVRLPVLHADAAQRLHAPPRSSCRRTVRGAEWFFSAQMSESLASTDLAHDILLPLACMLDL